MHIRNTGFTTAKSIATEFGIHAICVAILPANGTVGVAFQPQHQQRMGEISYNNQSDP